MQNNSTALQTAASVMTVKLNQQLLATFWRVIKVGQVFLAGLLHHISLVFLSCQLIVDKIHLSVTREIPDTVYMLKRQSWILSGVLLYPFIKYQSQHSNNSIHQLNRLFQLPKLALTKKLVLPDNLTLFLILNNSPTIKGLQDEYCN